MSDLDKIENVKIDSNGRFKYILIKLIHNNQEKFIVRGFKWAEYHADILDDFESNISTKEVKVECVGGGRILHEPEKKEIFVYGYSMGFGKADHTISVKLLKESYPSYENIHFSDEGY